MELSKAIDTRASVREFSSKKVKWGDVLEAIDAASKAPFAGNINNLKFIIVEEKETKDRISEHCQQAWMAKAGFIVVVCSEEGRLSKTYGERGVLYSKQQAGAAIENFLLRAHSLGLSSCWVGAYADELVKSLLKIPDKMTVEAILPVGHAVKKTKQAGKNSLENLIYWESWGEKKKSPKMKDILS